MSFCVPNIFFFYHLPIFCRPGLVWAQRDSQPGATIDAYNDLFLKISAPPLLISPARPLPPPTCSFRYGRQLALASDPWLLRKSALLRALEYTRRTEGVTALWRGLMPMLAGIVPSRGCYFMCYSKFKPMVTRWNGGDETSGVHLTAGVLAGLVTTTVTNPLWVVKTQAQLLVQEVQAQGAMASAGIAAAPAVQTAAVTAARAGRLPSMAVARNIWRTEGVRGFFRGVSASYVGE
jgi:hypothetical protein